MRRKTSSHSKQLLPLVFLTIVLLFNIIHLSNLATAQEEQPNLVVTLDERTFKVNEHFIVTVKDENGNPVEGATVGIQSLGETSKTDSEGLAQLVAPEVEEDNTRITVVAQKIGYTSGTTTAWITKEVTIFDIIMGSPYSPIFFAVILLILAVVFVNLRHRRFEKFVDTRAHEISEEQTIQRYTPDEEIATLPTTEKVRGVSASQNISKEEKNIRIEKEPKVEEIRINRPQNEKKIVSVETEQEEERKVIPRKTNKEYEYDWFEGTDDVRYEIDKITGEVDEERLDKWFEGIEGIRVKIDEKLKKKDKAKDK